MKQSALFSGAAFFMMVLLSQCSGNNQQSSSALTAEEQIKRGEYLVTTMGCNDCHSPKRMGPQGPEIIPELMLSGYPGDKPLPKVDTAIFRQGWVILTEDLTAAAGPWGVSYAANLTPDASGIGNWPLENFKIALKQGKFKGMEGSRMLLPPMPWQNFLHITDEDVEAIYAYLQSIPPVRNVVPAALPLAEVK
jgi:mono/diheme cytochrome c family protein